MRGGCRAQVSMEYLFIMGFALLITIPLIVVYYTQVGRLNDEVGNAAAERAVAQLAEAADAVYYLGEPSLRTITIDLPKNVQSISIAEQSITILVDSGAGLYESVSFAATNLTGTLGTTAGPHIVLLTALPNNMVNITEQ